MTHGHLGFDFTDGFQNNTDNDDDRRTTERQTREVAAAQNIDKERENRDDAEKKRTDERDTVENLGDVIRRGTTGTDTGNGTAVRLEVVRNFNRIEGNRNIEVRKCDEKNKRQNHVKNAVAFKQTEEACPERAFRRVHEHRNRGRNRHDGVCEDDRHNAGHVDLNRQVGRLTAVNLSADNSLCVLNRNTTFAVRHPNDEANHRNHNRNRKDCDDDACPYGNRCRRSVTFDIRPLTGNVGDERTEHTGKSGNDVRKENHGDPVADTVFVNLFSKPHNECRPCAVAHHDNEACEEAVVNQKAVGREESGVTDGGDETERNGYITGDRVNLLLAFFTFLGEVFQVGDSDAEKLHNDRGCDIRVDTQSEQGRLGERTTGQDVQVSEN